MEQHFRWGWEIVIPMRSASGDLSVARESAPCFILYLRQLTQCLIAVLQKVLAANFCMSETAFCESCNCFSLFFYLNPTSQPKESPKCIILRFHFSFPPIRIFQPSFVHVVRLRHLGFQLAMQLCKTKDARCKRALVCFCHFLADARRFFVLSSDFGRKSSLVDVFS